MGLLTNITIKKAAPGRLGDGGGLEIHKTESGGKWIWRYSFSGKRRQMGLGSYPVVGLADARRERDKWALVLNQGVDPISARQAEAEEARRELEKHDPTLEELTLIVFEAIKGSLKGDGVNGRWLSPLEIHVFPKLGKKRISAIHQSDIRSAIAPIWRKKHPTAEKAIDRLRIAFRHGKLAGYDCDPFTVDAAKHLLGDYHHKTVSIKATPWEDIPALFERLEGRGTVANCLRFMILTLVRGTGCREARFEEIENGVWTVPADRMKGKVGLVSDFRVPLPEAALSIIEEQRAMGFDVVFPGHRGKSISDNSLALHLNKLNEPGRPHGFRTSFRTWVQDTEATSYDVAETILAHTLGGKVERSYARSDMLDRRRLVMEAWADFVTGAERKVIPLRGSR